MLREGDEYDWVGLLGWSRISNRSRTVREIAESFSLGPKAKVARDNSTAWLEDPEEKKTAKTAKIDEETKMDMGKALFAAEKGLIDTDVKKHAAILQLDAGSVHFMRSPLDEMYTTIEFGRMRSEMTLRRILVSKPLALASA